MEKLYYNFIADIDLTKKFYSHVLSGEYALRSGEVYFMASSARAKDLDPEECTALGIGGTEMYHSEIVPYIKDDQTGQLNLEAYIQRVCRFECNSSGYVTKIGRKPFPQECLGLYVGVNPISVKKAFLCRLKEMNDLFELLVMSKDTENESVLNSMSRCIKLSNKIATRAVSRKNWLDIDIDLVSSYKTTMNYHKIDIEDDILFKIRQSAEESGFADRKFITIYTKGGVHVLFQTKDLKQNPEQLLKQLKVHFGQISKEIEFSTGGVPLPGTYQRGEHVVNFDVLDLPFFKNKENKLF